MTGFPRTPNSFEVLEIGVKTGAHIDVMRGTEINQYKLEAKLNLVEEIYLHFELLVATLHGTELPSGHSRMLMPSTVSSWR